MPNPPLELLNQLCRGRGREAGVRAQVDRRGVASIEKGKAGKIWSRRSARKDADADIAIAPLFTPPNVTAADQADPEGEEEGGDRRHGRAGRSGRTGDR